MCFFSLSLSLFSSFSFFSFFRFFWPSSSRTLPRGCTCTECTGNRPVNIIGDPSTAVIVTLNKPMVLQCYAVGWPRPYTTWWRADKILPKQYGVFEQFEDHSLIIQVVTDDVLGPYTCQAYNGEGRAASWSVTLQAYYTPTADDNRRPYNPYLIPPPPAWANYGPTAGRVTRPPPVYRLETTESKRVTDDVAQATPPPPIFYNGKLLVGKTTRFYFFFFVFISFHRDPIECNKKKTFTPTRIRMLEGVIRRQTFNRFFFFFAPVVTAFTHNTLSKCIIRFQALSPRRMAVFRLRSSHQSHSCPRELETKELVHSRKEHRTIHVSSKQFVFFFSHFQKKLDPSKAIILYGRFTQCFSRNENNFNMESFKVNVKLSVYKSPCTYR